MGEVAITLSAVRTQTNNRVKVLASVVPDEGTKRTPVDICCVVDISGSMSTTATFQNDKGETESHGLTILDIVKHAVETIIHTLGEDDRLSIVAYSTTAEVITDLLTMNEDGKKTSSEKLKTLRPTNSTNLWDGLHSGMEVLRKGQQEGRLSAVFILTDGMPNVEPPSGHIPMLKKYKDNNKLECTISSFGFGYSMDSPLLNDIAIEGSGMYAFIPDSGFVGTTFVNALSNLLVTKAKQVTLNIETAPGYTVVPPSPASSAFSVTSWGASVSLGTLHFGQTRDVLIELEAATDAAPITDDNPLVTASVAFEPCSSGCNTASQEAKVSSIGDETILEVEQQTFRQNLISVILKSPSLTLSKASALVSDFVNTVKASPHLSDEYITGILADAEGQVTEALSKNEYYQKWGKHYLPSLARAHQLQQCNNFKDPGIQFYGGDLFNEIRDIGDDIFISLPPPQPSQNSYCSYGSSSGYAYSPPVSMNSYYCSSNPCFSGDSLVAMADGTLKPCNMIQKGDFILSGKRDIAQVLCVVETKCEHGRAELVSLEGGLKITSYHPVRMNGTWHFPCDLATPVEMDCPSVFSYVLDSYHTMEINGIECVTLGHNFTEDTVAHPYFGSDLVVNDLKQMNGWDHGKVVFRPGCMRKDFNTDLVCAFDRNCVVSLIC